MSQGRNSRLVIRGTLIGVSFALAWAFVLAGPGLGQSGSGSVQTTTPAGKFEAPSSSDEKPDVKTDSKSGVKADPKQAKVSYHHGIDCERRHDWQEAYDAYVEAVDLDPGNRDYLLRRELVKGQLVQDKEELAERDAVAGKLGDARKALLEASYLDPTDRSITDRLAQLVDLEPRSADEPRRQPQISSPVSLAYRRGKQNINYRGDTRGGYQRIAQLFGVEVAFDVDLHSLPVQFQLNDVDFLTALDVLGQMTHTFWEPVSHRLFSVADDTADNRKAYETLIVRTIPLPASETPEQMQEIFRLVHEMATTHSDIDLQGRTITLRGAPRAVAIASELVETLEQPVGELILEIEVLEVDRNYATQIGITPPETSTVYSLASQQLNEASSLTGLISLIEQIFGTPSSLSGLTPTQIATEIDSGQVNLGSLLPPLVAFGGGRTTFVATMPGASGTLSQTLSLVRSGRRVLMRAEDGQPATFFVGEKFPVSLAQYSSSLTSNVNTTAISTQNFPITTLTTGTAPTYITTATLRSNNIQDLIVANGSDNDISVFLGNGDGTFVTPAPTYPTGSDPVWIASGAFQANGNISLAVANEKSNTVSVLPGKGDGTFGSATSYATGSVPVSIVAGNFAGQGNVDLAVANQGDNTISLFFNDGTGKFSAPTGVPALLGTGSAPAGLATADLRGVGRADLLVVNKNANTVSVFLSNGDGTFQPRTDYATGVAPVYVATGDFNGDGVLDLAVANYTDGTVSILFGQTGSNGSASGTFAPRTDYIAGTNPTSIAVADYNLDGILDLALTDSTSNTISLLFGLTGGTFNSNYEVSVGSDPLSIVTADFNGDGRPDAAIANNGSNTASVILNETSTSTSSTGGQGTQFPNSQYIDIGLKIKATPRIHLDDEVTLQLHFEMTSLAGQSFNSIPVINSDMLDQTVRLKENETTALGGIMEPSVTRSLSGTPGLAAIPGLGALAAMQGLQQQDTQLLVLITPRMVSLAPRKDHVIYAGRGGAPAPGGTAAGRPERALPRGEQQQPGPPPAQAPPQAPPGPGPENPRRPDQPPQT